MAGAQGIRIVRTVETKETHTLEITPEVLIKALRDQGYEIPASAVVQFTPLCQLYAGETTEIGSDDKLVVLWTQYDCRVEGETT